MARKNTKKVNVRNVAEPVKSAAPVETADVKEPAVEAVSVKEDAVVEEKPAEEIKEAVKTEEESNKRGRKSGVKNKAEKAPAKEVEKTGNIFIQTAGLQYDTGKIVADVRAAWVAEGHRESSIKSLNIYINMDERKAYYVINDKNTGSVGLFAM